MVITELGERKEILGGWGLILFWPFISVENVREDGFNKRDTSLDSAERELW